MKVFKQFVCVLMITIMLFSLCYENVVFAESSDQSVQAFEKMSDEYMKKVLEEYKVAGVTVSVVKDGKEFFKKGYGYADLEKKKAVDPEITTFEIASVSKLFTATAAMQLVEQGKLSLEEDVNKYLTDFKIENNFSKPVTLKTLLTHTGGFDDKIPIYYKSKGEKFYDSLEPLGKYLKENMPPVIREPGTYCQYSGYGYALIGYLVEKVSGTTFDKYVSDNILKPLHMDNSSYGLNENILSRTAKPYNYRNGKYSEDAYTLCNDHPSGSIFASASDMSKFMIMHLNNGKYNGAEILKESTAKDMHKRNDTRDEKLMSYGLGFLENKVNGYREIGHGGYLPCFSSRLTIMPEKNIGIFISLNTDSKDSSKVCGEFADKFYNFFTTKVKKEENLDGDSNIPFDMDEKKINGNYTTEGYTHSDLLKIKSVIPGTSLAVKCDNKGNLILNKGKTQINYKYVGNGLFYSKEQNDYYKVSNINNKMVFSIGFAECEKVPSGNICLFYAVIAGVVIFLIAIIALSISLFKKRKIKDKQALILKCALIVMSFLMISYMVLNVVISLKCMRADTSSIFNVLMPIIKAVCYFSLITILISVKYVIDCWIKNKLLLRAKVFYSIVIIFGVINVVFMYIMNGFNIF